MEKQEFVLDNEDFNYLCEISANDQNVIQVHGNAAVFKTQVDRSMSLWKRFAEKYGFIPETVEANLPERDARYFLAVPLVRKGSAPKKLVRDGIKDLLKDGEWAVVENPDELNNLYALKIKEELSEVVASKCKDVKEFADLINVAFKFAQANGFTKKQLVEVIIDKENEKGVFSNIVLTNLNPNNPSNKLYFE